MVKTEIKLMKRSTSGFTLLELLVVVGILAALVALALPFYQDYVNQSKLTAAEADLQTYKKALAMYDQLESTMFKDGNFINLIGRYLQDFRTSSGQTMPLDPWGNDYVMSASSGVVLSTGPDGARQTDMTTRLSAGDDIVVTWKPPYFVSGARAVNQNTIEISFSRKIVDSTALNSNALVTAVTDMTVSATKKVQKVSDTVYRVFLTTNMVKGATYTVTVAVRNSQDGSTAYDANPAGGGGNTVLFVY